MYKIHDVSMTIYEGMPVYKNKAEKQPQVKRVTNGYVSETRISLDVHGGTHVDAPLHMIPKGKTIEKIELKQLVRPCKVLDLTGIQDGIEKKHLVDKSIESGDFILLKTDNSNDEIFNPHFIALKEDGATYLADKGIEGVGIDSLGIERGQEGHPTHKTLFQQDIIIIEGLRLQDIVEGSYFMIAAPLKLSGIDAAPARILLLEGFSI